MYFLCFGMGTMLANFHMCGIMLLLRAVLYIGMEDLFIIKKESTENIIYNNTNTLAQRHSPAHFTHAITGICNGSMI